MRDTEMEQILNPSPIQVLILRGETQITIPRLFLATLIAAAKSINLLLLKSVSKTKLEKDN